MFEGTDAVVRREMCFEEMRRGIGIRIQLDREKNQRPPARRIGSFADGIQQIPTSPE